LKSGDNRPRKINYMNTINRYLLVILPLLLTFQISAQNFNIVINELMAKNTTYAADENGQFDDYIELRNNSGTEWQSLKNWTLTDTLGIPDKWTFPEETSMPPNSYLVLWADEDGGQGELHVNFKLDGDGEELYLFDQNGNMIDQVFFTDQVEDMSYSRIPNGTGDFVIKNGTIGFNNEHTSSVDNQLADQYKIYPNPVNDLLFIDNLQQVEAQVQIFDLIGNRILSEKMDQTTTNIDLSALSPGMYIITINGGLSDRFIKL